MMMTIDFRKLFILAAVCFMVPNMVAEGQSAEKSTPTEETEETDNPLALLDPFVGKIYKALVANTDEGEPVYDVSHWEWTLGGDAVRVRHSVGDGTYAGETLMTYDSRSGTIVYFYATTGGFYSRGQLRVQDNVFTTTEVVTGNPDGIVGVQSTGILMDDGSLHMLTSMRTRQGWGEPDTTIYLPAPDAEVVFHDIK